MTNAPAQLRKIFAGQPRIYWLYVMAGLLFLIAVVPYWLERPGVVTTRELTRLRYAAGAPLLFSVSALAWLCALVKTPPANKRLRRLTAAVFTVFLLTALPWINFVSLQISLSVGLLAFGFIYFNLLPQLVLGAAIGVILLLPFAFLPSGLINETRSPVAQVRADQRSLATAIEAYFLDHDAYPPHTYDYSKALWQSKTRMPTFLIGSIDNLTTPVAYLSEYFMEDYFHQFREKRTFAYYARPDNWIAISAGPNCRFELQPERLDTIFEGRIPSDYLTNFTYDPSNGTDSAGDVWRVKQ